MNPYWKFRMRPLILGLAIAVLRFVGPASDDATVRLWDLEKGTCLREFQGHSREVTGTEFSSNGRFAISSSLDGAVMIWELDWEWTFSARKPEIGPAY